MDTPYASHHTLYVNCNSNPDAAKKDGPFGFKCVGGRKDATGWADIWINVRWWRVIRRMTYVPFMRSCSVEDLEGLIDMRNA